MLSTEIFNCYQHNSKGNKQDEIGSLKQGCTLNVLQTSHLLQQSEGGNLRQRCTKRCTKRLRRKPSDFLLTSIDSRGLQVLVKSGCTDIRLAIFKLMLINTELLWLFKFFDYNRPIYAPKEHEILQSYSFIWHLRWKARSTCLQADNTFTLCQDIFRRIHLLSYI